MRCEQFDQELEAFLSEEVDERTASDMRAHAESCPDCRHVLESTSNLTNILKVRGPYTMTRSMENNIRDRVSECVAGRPRTARLGGLRWAFVGAAIAVVLLTGLSLMRQQSATAAEVIARAEAKLNSVTSYHVKYRDTQLGVWGSRVRYTEIWHQSPGEMKMVLHETSPASESGASDLVRIVKGSSQWTYVSGSGAVFLTPLSDSAQRGLAMRFKTPQDMLRNLAKDSGYAGTAKVGERECDVIELTIGRVNGKAYIDRQTGLLLRSVTTENGKLRAKMDAVDLQVNKPIPDEVFKPELSPGVTLVKVPSTPETDGLPLAPSLSTVPNAANWKSQLRQPDDVVAELTQLGEKGAKNGAQLKRLYRPGYVPNGHMLSDVWQVPERFKTPSGTTGRRLRPGVYSTIHIDYINPDTGGAIVLTESVDRPQAPEGKNVSSDGFEGWIAKHNEPFPYIDLYWEVDGVYFTLGASSLDEREAVTMAQSMQQVFPR